MVAQTAPWSGIIALCIVFATLGISLIELGRRGRARRVDYSFGGYTLENCGESAFDEAHGIVGRNLLWSGGLYLVAAVLVVLSRRDLWVAAVSIGVAVLTMVLLLFSITRAVKILGSANAVQRQTATTARR